MWRAMMRVGVAALVLLAMAPPARAQCVEDARAVALDADNVVRLRSHVCTLGSGPDAAQLRVEQHRFSDVAASLIVARRASTLLARTIGRPVLVDNAVSRAYAELIARFGVTMEFTGEEVSDGMLAGLSIDASEGGGMVGESQDSMPAGRLRSVLGADDQWNDYPAADEIAALRRGMIPPGLRFFYEVWCNDEDGDAPEGGARCADMDPGSAQMRFWRGMREEDLQLHAQRVQAYNRLLSQFRAELRASRGGEAPLTAEPIGRSALPRALQLYRYVAGEAWPEDFVFLVGGITTTCGDGIGGIGGWIFRHTTRTPFLEAVLIENASARPLALAAVVGTRVQAPRLRPMPYPAAAGQPLPLQVTLAPGQRLLLPTRIVFAPGRLDKAMFRYTETSREIWQQLGTNGLLGDAAAHGAPIMRDYAYGPELAVSGLQVDGRRVDLVRQRANFTVLAVSSQIGSCPYLLSADAHGADWIEHGKVLHRAQGSAREETASLVVPGFRPLFRVEEREAEAAFIDVAELALRLKNGRVLVLAPAEARLAARDRDYLRLLWGEAAEFAFALPAGVSADDVLESRLSLTGFYEPYRAPVERTVFAPAPMRCQPGSAL